MFNRFRLDLLFGLLPAICCIAAESSSLPVATSPQNHLRRIEDENLPNAIQVSKQVISGGQPAGEKGFRALQRLGVKTAISVDGLRPEFELANRYGIRYVHLPHGYSGISNRRQLELAKAVRDSQGPIYIHCHHGKHRSPAAAAVATIGLGLVKPSAGREILQQAGTSLHYRGLFQAVDSAEPVAENVLDELPVQFHQAVQLPPVAEAMVQLEQNIERIKLIAKSSWKVPKTHPDILPRHEALMLREQLVEFQRHIATENKSNQYQRYLEEGISAAKALESAIERQGEKGFDTQCDQAFKSILNNCQKCHQRFRDNLRP